MPGFTQIPNDWVFDDPLWTSEKFTKGMALSDLYRLQQYHPGVIQKRGIIIELEPGQIGWSQAELAKRWKRSIGWVRRLLKYLKKTGHIELQKTNVSTTITLLHWINNDTANKHANGKQTVSQTESKRYPNNIVNTVNRENIENTPSLGLDFEKLWYGWIGDSQSSPTKAEQDIIINALKHNSNANDFWLPKLEERKKILESGGSTPSNMKYWFDGGFREMTDSEQSINKNSKVHIQEGHLDQKRDW